MRNFCVLLIAALCTLLSGCADEKPQKIEIEVQTSSIPEPPYMGEKASFYRGNADAFTAMWAWCKEYVDSVRTEPQSKECSTVMHVHLTGGPTKVAERVEPPEKNLVLPPIAPHK